MTRCGREIGVSNGEIALRLHWRTSPVATSYTMLARNGRSAVCGHESTTVTCLPLTLTLGT